MCVVNVSVIHSSGLQTGLGGGLGGLAGGGFGTTGLGIGQAKPVLGTGGGLGGLGLGTGTNTLGGTVHSYCKAMYASCEYVVFCRSGWGPAGTKQPDTVSQSLSPPHTPSSTLFFLSPSPSEPRTSCRC